MQKNDAGRIARKLETTYGVPLSEQIGIADGYQYIGFHLDILPTLTSCSVFTQIFWKSIEISLMPDDYGRDLIESMGKSPEGNRAFSVVASDILRNLGKIDFLINDHQVDPEKAETWDSDWSRVKLKITIFTDDTDLSDIKNLEPVLIVWVGRFFMLLLSLLPVEKEQIPAEVQGLPEGAVTCVTVNKYERDPVNREICIALNGCYCHACGLNFEAEYGIIGSGYIHVHHNTPVSKLGPDYIIDPSRDLVPVCPNCHAMLHKSDPPLSIEKLKEIIRKHSDPAVQ